MSASGKPIQEHVANEVSRALIGALAGAAIVWFLDRYTPLKPQWWIGVAVGAAVAASYEWKQDN